jgi:hypothetical protein
MNEPKKADEEHHETPQETLPSDMKVPSSEYPQTDVKSRTGAVAQDGASQSKEKVTGREQ